MGFLFCVPITGNSGMGSYHGRHSFDQLSHLRSCLIKQLKMEGVNSMRYPPHTAKKLGWARFLLLRQVNVCKLRRMMLVATLVSLAAFVVQVIHLFQLLLCEFYWSFIELFSSVLCTYSSAGPCVD